MIRIAVSVVALAGLMSCGAGGEPTAPTVSGKTTFGVNSNTGAYTKTTIGIQYDLN